MKTILEYTLAALFWPLFICLGIALEAGFGWAMLVIFALIIYAVVINLVFDNSEEETI